LPSTLPTVIAVSAKVQTVRAPKTFDTAKFETMVEPFTVRVEKIKGTMKMEIPLPQPEDGSAPGTNWSKDQVRDLTRWLVTEWAGGGHYVIAISDGSTPPQTMEWTAFYPTTEFPEKVPPPLQGAFMPSTPTPTQVKPTMASFPGSGSSLPPASLFPTAAPVPTVPTVPAPQPGYFPPTPYPFATPLPTLGGSAASGEVAALREQLTRAREEALARDFERRLAEMKAESDRQMQTLQQSMTAMVQQLTQAVQQRAAAADPAVEQLREANRRLEEQLTQQRTEMERARREAELREEIRRTQEQQARLVEESNRRLEEFMRANANKGPDPQLLMFQQMMQAQMEAMKDIARTSQVQLDRIQNFMMRPQDVLAIAKESTTNTDHVVQNIARQYESMFGLSRQLIEQAAQLNSGGGGNQVIDLVRDGVANLAEMARKYTGDKTKEQVAAMNAQAEIAKAQAEVQKAQLERMAQMAAMEAAMKAGVAAPMPSGGYAGPPGVQQPAIGAPSVRAPKMSNGLNGLNGANGAPANVVPFKPNDGGRRRGRTDEEWFGPTLPKVLELRESVDKFLDALRETPPRRDGAEPSEVADAIQQAAAYVMQANLPIPALTELLAQGMIADFLDVLLPNATQAYRDEVAKLLMESAVGEDDEDEDGDEDDDAQETSPQVG